jgi:FtsH-binding integral membrane protein
MPVNVSVALLAVVFAVAIINRKLPRANPSLFLAITFFAGFLVSAPAPVATYIKLAAALLSGLLLTLVVVNTSRDVLTRMRAELVLLIACIVALVTSALILSDTSAAREPVSLIAILFAIAFVVFGGIRVNVLLIRALRQKAKSL